MQQWFSGGLQRTAGAGSGLSVDGAAVRAQPALGGAQSAHAAPAGGACGVRCGVALGGGHVAGPGGGAARRGGGVAHVGTQRVHQPQPAAYQPCGGRGGGGLQLVAAFRRRAGGGDVSNTRPRRPFGRHPLELRGGANRGGVHVGGWTWCRLCILVCLCAGGADGPAVGAGAQVRGARVDRVADAVSRPRGAPLRLRLGPRPAGLAVGVPGLPLAVRRRGHGRPPRRG